MQKIYLDHSATTPVRTEVANLVYEYMTRKFGNPSTVYSFGREAKEALTKARNQVAQLIKSQSQEIIFTSGGTESDNIAIIGVAKYYSHLGKHIITSAIEHHAVLEACESLKQDGFVITVLPVDENGFVRLEDVKNAIRKDTILITIMHANNEVGTIQPIKEIGQLAKEKGIIFHTDAVQSLGKIAIDVNSMQVDLLSGSGHKIYAPKGTGFLYIKEGMEILPLQHGGGQEQDFRPGTENVSGIVGLGLACELAGKEMAEQMKRIKNLRDRLIKGLKEKNPDVILNGHPEKRVPINVNLSFPGIKGKDLLYALDKKGIAASSGSACSTGNIFPSHVLLAMGISEEIAQSSVRMTLGRDNTLKDIEYVLEVLPALVSQLKKM